MIYYALLLAGSLTAVPVTFATDVAETATTQTQIEAFRDYVREFREDKDIPSLSVAFVKD